MSGYRETSDIVWGVSESMDSNNEDNQQGESEEEESTMSEEGILLNDEDVWDDSLLIKMYEDSQKVIHDALNKTFTAKNDKQIHSNNSNATTFQWKSGDYCRSIYTEDQVEYEAIILKVNTVAQNAIIRYIGYENEEQQSLSNLKLSLGPLARKEQADQAQADGYISQQQQKQHHQQQNQEKKALVDLVNFSSCKPSTSSGTNNIKSSIFDPCPSTSDSTKVLLPPMPSLEAIKPNELQVDDDDALASMLMSWYMSGYHTGYYQARKENKCQCNNNNKKV